MKYIKWGALIGFLIGLIVMGIIFLTPHHNPDNSPFVLPVTFSIFSVLLEQTGELFLIGLSYVHLCCPQFGSGADSDPSLIYIYTFTTVLGATIWGVIFGVIIAGISKIHSRFFK